MSELTDGVEKFLRETADELTHITRGLDDEFSLSHLVFGENEHEGVTYMATIDGNKDVQHLKHRNLDPLLGRRAMRLGQDMGPTVFYQFDDYRDS